MSSERFDQDSKLRQRLEQCMIYGWVGYLLWGYILDRPCWGNLWEMYASLLFCKETLKIIIACCEACALPIILYHPPANFILFLGVWVSATSQISSTNVTSRRHAALWCGFLGTTSTPCMRNYQRQGHMLPPGAVSSCYPQKLLRIETLSYQHYHDLWLTETQNLITTYKSNLDVSPLP